MGALRRRPGRKTGVPFDPAHSTTIRPEIRLPIASNKTFFVLRRGKNQSDPVSGRKISLLYRFFLNKVLFSYPGVSRARVSDGEREGEKGIFPGGLCTIGTGPHCRRVHFVGGELFRVFHYDVTTRWDAHSAAAHERPFRCVCRVDTQNELCR